MYNLILIYIKIIFLIFLLFFLKSVYEELFKQIHSRNRIKMKRKNCLN